MSEYIKNLKILRNRAASNSLGEGISESDSKLIKSALSKVISQDDFIEDVFVNFYESIINDDLEVDFKSILGAPDYEGASMYSRLCIGEAKSIKNLPTNIRIGTWVLNALKFVDYIVVHYIQVVKEEVPDNGLIENDNTSYGDERLRYKMLQRYEHSVSNAGSWLLDMYDLRTRLVHNTQIEKQTNRHVFKIENYSQISRSAAKLYPRILKTFQIVYK